MQLTSHDDHSVTILYTESWTCCVISMNVTESFAFNDSLQKPVLGQEHRFLDSVQMIRCLQLMLMAADERWAAAK